MRKLTGHFKKAICLIASFALAASMLPASALARDGGGDSPLKAGALSSSGKMEIVQVMLGCQSRSAVVMSDGSLWMWGNSSRWEFGDGTSEYYNDTPVKVMDGVAEVSLGSYHTAALKEDGSLWTCGSNYYGEIGDGTTTARHFFVKVMDGVAQVSLGGNPLRRPEGGRIALDLGG